MRKSVLSIAALLLFAVAGFAQDKFVLPEQKIQGGEDVISAGEVIILKATPLNQKPKYLTDVNYQWKVLEEGKDKKNIIVWPDGSSVVFGAGVLSPNQKTKKMTALLVVNYLYTVREGDAPTGKILEVGQRSSGILMQDIYIGGPPPPPGPPTPPPEPEPVFPDGKYKLAATSYKLAKTTVASLDSRIKGAEAVVIGTEGIASAISAGVLTDVTDILKKLKAKNNSQLELAKIDINDWTLFGKALENELYQLYKDKKLSTAADFAVAFREIAEGLRKVK